MKSILLTVFFLWIVLLMWRLKTGHQTSGTHCPPTKMTFIGLKSLQESVMSDNSVTKMNSNECWKVDIAELVSARKLGGVYKGVCGPHKALQGDSGASVPCFLLCPWMNWAVPPFPGLLSVICILSRERRMLQIRLREKKMTLTPWLRRAPSTRQTGCILSARSPGGASLTGSICSTRGCDPGPGGSICPPRKNHTPPPWGQGGNPCTTHPM